LRSQQVVAAPNVQTSGLVLSEGEARPAAEVSKAPALGTKNLRYNPTVDELYGGERADRNAVNKAIQNHTSGHVEDAALPSAVFEEQYTMFNAQGRALAPDGRHFGDAGGAGAQRTPCATAAPRRAGCLRRCVKLVHEQHTVSRYVSTRVVPLSADIFLQLSMA
jgi:hypothetical protein